MSATSSVGRARASLSTAHKAEVLGRRWESSAWCSGHSGATSSGPIVRPRVFRGAAGIAAGIGSAALLARLMGAVLFAVAATDLMTYSSVSLLLIVVTLVACYVPARRPTKQDPLTACVGAWSKRSIACPR
jgi:hypothetical protein